MIRPLAPLPAGALTLVQVGPRGGLPEPWERVESLEAIRFVDPDGEVEEPAGARSVIRTLASRPGPVALHLTRAPAAASFLAPNESFLGALETGGAFDTLGTAVHEATTLDESLAALGVERVDVLDLDVPGRELGILEGARKLLGERVFGIEVDVGLNPLYDRQPLAGEVDSLLRGLGYELFQFLPRRLRRKAGSELLVLGKGQPVLAEALYLRGPPAAVAGFESCDGGKREEAIGRAVSVCLLYGFGDYALDLVDSTSLPVPTARRLRRAIVRYDSHIDRRVPERFAREEHGRVLEPIATWLGSLNPAAAPGRAHVALELEQVRRLFRVAGRGDAELAGKLREALDWGLARLKDERAERRAR